ncbi:MAG: MucB/RseB C-terminal domain-containing protein, partial [Neisseriaceae bacterium]|nr:MucB/RseB C-terminal domain-containing protein [Neisseriaceae bacterium]
AILPWHISQLSESYEATSHGAGRVAGRNCHIVRLTPYDGNRYTQELCLDDTDNLPLSRTYIHHNSVVRADLFSAIDREHTPQAQELLPSNALTYKVVRKFDERFAWAAQDDDFINSVLSGYTITGKERTPYGYYYLFTDGLTHIVLFIDPADEHSDAVSIVPTDGVLSSASIKVDTYRLTAVGDLPPNGLNQWLNSVSLNHQ